MKYIVIATGANRFSKNWRNKKLSWAEFIDMIKETRRTGETFAEYSKFTKKDRDNCKDIGGFVGGKINGHTRLVTSVEYRTLVCLDADHAGSGNFLADVNNAFPDTAYAIYTTHSHSPGSPRYRLIFPLSRPATPDEYQPLCRKIAEDIGIETFDPTTYDIHRLMYWPSTSMDGEFVFERNKGKPLNVDAVLDSYKDWQNIEEWPLSSLEVKANGLAIKKQADPLAKPGLIGAFCRAYTIRGAIETFLPGVYEEKTEDRYTYSEGSTAGGLIIYDDKFAFSHHATDPTSGQLCNAFDFVRIHLFGDKDGQRALDLDDPKKLPSYKLMMEKAAADDATKAELAETDLAELKELFDDEMLVQDTEIDTSWLKKLERGGKDASIVSNAKNVMLILDNDALLKHTFGVDEFQHRLMVLRDLPWRKKAKGEIWDDLDDSCLRNYLSEYYGITGKPVILDAFTQIANKNSFHPVKNYLNGLKWDGIKRAETIYIDYLGAEDCKMVREFTMLHLKAAVARIFNPGTKFDECIVLSGAQGQGKTTILEWLGGKWFNESITDIKDRNVMESLQGSWIIELSEMQATRKAENDAIKAFISRRVDRFRVPYGMRTNDYPRQCVFAGTVNEDVFLKDRTGSRRFWPIFTTKALDARLLTQSLRDAVWAEVMEAWKHDGNLLLSPESRIAAKKEQDDATEGGEKRDLICAYLDKKLPEDWEELDLFDRKNYLANYSEQLNGGGVVRYRVCLYEIWCEALNQPQNKFTTADARELNAIMSMLINWERPKDDKRHTFGNLYGRQRYFRRKI